MPVAGRVAADAEGIRESARWLHRKEEGPGNGALFSFVIYGSFEPD